MELTREDFEHLRDLVTLSMWQHHDGLNPKKLKRYDERQQAVKELLNIEVERDEKLLVKLETIIYGHPLCALGTRLRKYEND